MRAENAKLTTTRTLKSVLEVLRHGFQTVLLDMHWGHVREKVLRELIHCQSWALISTFVDRAHSVINVGQH